VTARILSSILPHHELSGVSALELMEILCVTYDEEKDEVMCLVPDLINEHLRKPKLSQKCIQSPECTTLLCVYSMILLLPFCCIYAAQS
jgi:hypothetical protein